MFWVSEKWFIAKPLSFWMTLRVCRQNKLFGVLNALWQMHYNAACCSLQMPSNWYISMGIQAFLKPRTSYSAADPSARYATSSHPPENKRPPSAWKGAYWSAAALLGDAWSPAQRIGQHWQENKTDIDWPTHFTSLHQESMKCAG